MNQYIEKYGRGFTETKTPGFGQLMGPLMAICEFKNGKWGDLVVKEYGPLSLSPSAKVLHYAQEIFEGMKAYKNNHRAPVLFRPLENFKRFNRSAKRMAMPEIPENIFMDSIRHVVSLSENIIPTKKGESLYLRPFMIATDETLGVKPSDTYLYVLITSPSAGYFSGGDLGVLIEREHARAFKGGIGFAKTGGNYAASLESYHKMKEHSLSQTLWLDAAQHCFIEELSGMNFFAIIGNELHTPELNDSILQGITRESLMILAQSLQLKVIERKIEINLLIEDIKNGHCTEAFACGTAAIISPIAFLCESSGEKYFLKHPNGFKSLELKDALLNIQQQTAPDLYQWVYEIQS